MSQIPASFRVKRFLPGPSAAHLPKTHAHRLRTFLVGVPGLQDKGCPASSLPLLEKMASDSKPLLTLPRTKTASWSSEGNLDSGGFPLPSPPGACRDLKSPSALVQLGCTTLLPPLRHGAVRPLACPRACPPPGSSARLSWGPGRGQWRGASRQVPRPGSVSQG